MAFGTQEDKCQLMSGTHATPRHIKFLVERNKPSSFHVDLYSLNKRVQVGTMTYSNKTWHIDVDDETVLCYYFCTEPHESYIDDLDLKWRKDKSNPKSDHKLFEAVTRVVKEFFSDWRDGNKWGSDDLAEFIVDAFDTQTDERYNALAKFLKPKVKYMLEDGVSETRMINVLSTYLKK